MTYVDTYILQPNRVSNMSHDVIYMVTHLSQQVDMYILQYDSNWHVHSMLWFDFLSWPHVASSELTIRLSKVDTYNIPCDLCRHVHSPTKPVPKHESRRNIRGCLSFAAKWTRIFYNTTQIDMYILCCDLISCHGPMWQVLNSPYA